MLDGKDVAQQAKNSFIKDAAKAMPVVEGVKGAEKVADNTPDRKNTPNTSKTDKMEGGENQKPANESGNDKKTTNEKDKTEGENTSKEKNPSDETEGRKVTREDNGRKTGSGVETSGEVKETKVEDLKEKIDDKDGSRVLEDGTSFTWKLRGKDVTLTNIIVQNISYVKRNSDELKNLRNEFNTTTRKAFLKDLGQNTEYLKNAGFSDDDILKIQSGRIPDGWQVHHKLPLDDSGTNSFDNLVLIKNEPYHKVITNYQNSMIRQMKVGDTKTIQWPIPNGNIYPMKH